MRINSRTKAVALLLLVSLQYTFATLDVALCSKALCYPKTSGAKYGAVSKKCPDGFELGKDGSGKAVCTKRVAKPCPDGTTLNDDGKCCAAAGTTKSCVPVPGFTKFSCPAGYTVMKDCDTTDTAAAPTPAANPSAPVAANPSAAPEPLSAPAAEPSSAPAATPSGPGAAEVTADTGRKLLTQIQNPFVKEINIEATKFVPTVILPKPALSFTINKPAEQITVLPSSPSKPKLQIPQIILPKPALSINIPAKQVQLTPSVSVEKGLTPPHLLPKIIPILPEPRITITSPGGQYTMPHPWPTVNKNITTKYVNIDLSNAGPSSTAEINLPAMPDLKQELFKKPTLDVKFPQLPKVIDLSALGPSKSVNLTLPEVKMPNPGSLTIRTNDQSNEPQFLDLSGVIHKIESAVTGKSLEEIEEPQSYNIVLPKVKAEGAVINLKVDNKDQFKDISLPLPGIKHDTVINVPGWNKTEMPQHEAKLTVDLSTKGSNALSNKLDALNELAKLKQHEDIDIQMPSVDLSQIKMLNKPDIVVDVKPLISFNHSNLLSADQLSANKPIKDIRVNVSMQDVSLPKIIKDTTVVIKPKEFNVTKFVPQAVVDKVDELTKPSTVTINLPEHALPTLPVPGGKTDINVAVPFKVGLLKQFDSSKGPDATLNFKYEDQWKGGNPDVSLPNPGSKIANVMGKAMNAVTSASCPTKCCKEVELAASCQEQEFEVQTAPVQYECESGCTYDLKHDKCLCSPGTAAACPAGHTKCSISGKGVCAPDVGKHVGIQVCEPLKALCSKVGIVAKTCQ